jgi:hypothetical protein
VGEKPGFFQLAERDIDLSWNRNRVFGIDSVFTRWEKKPGFFQLAERDIDLSWNRNRVFGMTESLQGSGA